MSNKRLYANRYHVTKKEKPKLNTNLQTSAICSLSKDMLKLHQAVIREVLARTEVRLQLRGRKVKDVRQLKMKMENKWVGKMKVQDPYDRNHYGISEPRTKHALSHFGPTLRIAKKTNDYIKGKGVPKSISGIHNPFEQPLSTIQRERKDKSLQYTPRIVQGVVQPAIMNDSTETSIVKSGDASDGELCSDDDISDEEEEFIKDEVIMQYTKIKHNVDGTFSLRVHGGIIKKDDRELCFKKADNGKITWGQEVL